MVIELFVTGSLLLNAQVREIERLIDKFPRCAESVERVEIHKSLPRKVAGSYSEHEIRIRDGVNDMKYVVAHECGHAVMDLRGVKTRNFGFPSFITEYASSNKYEDFAETYAHYVLNPRRLYRKSYRDERLMEKYRDMEYNVSVKK